MTSEIHLQSLWNMNQKKLDKEILDFIENWNKEERCLCCKNKQNIVECDHLENAIEKKFNKRVDEQYKKLVVQKTISLRSWLYQ